MLLFVWRGSPALELPGAHAGACRFHGYMHVDSEGNLFILLWNSALLYVRHIQYTTALEDSMTKARQFYINIGRLSRALSALQLVQGPPSGDQCKVFVIFYEKASLRGAAGCQGPAEDGGFRARRPDRGLRPRQLIT